METKKTIEELKKENEELGRINDLKTDLISMSTHQFRTSLTAVKWVIKMFLDQEVGELSEEQLGFMKKIYRSNEQMIGITNEMLFNNKNGGMEIKYNYTSEDIVPLIEEVIFDFIGESHERAVEIIFLKPEKPLPKVLIDKNKIRIVIQSLIENAIKYSQREDNIFISLKENEDNLEFSIKDNGIGVMDEDRDKIFNKFFRAKNAIQKEEIGTGFGLFTTKNIVERHHGKIWFESEAGKGTTFSFTIPVAK